MRLFSDWRLFIIIYFALFVPLFRPVVSLIDPVGYYAWARSLLIDNDLHVANEFAHYGMGKNLPITPTGYLHNQWAAGSGWIWFPAMAITHLGTLSGQALGIAVEADGYSTPYAWAASLTSTITGLGAIFLTYKLARKLFSDWVAQLSAIAIWLATPLVFYQYHQPLMSHAHDAFVNTLFVWVWWQARRNHFPPREIFYLGLIIGVAIWIRTQNGLLLPIMLADIGYDAVVEVWSKGKKANLKAIYTRGVALMSGFMLLFIPLLLFWRRVYGVWVLNTYSASGGGSFNWQAPHLLDVFLSTDRGLFIWTPITILCFVGVYPLFKTDRRLTGLLSGMVLSQLYIISSWSAWSGGDAFGPRFWIALTPFFGLSLAALIKYVGRPSLVKRFVFTGAIGLFIGWNFLLMLQYSLGLVAPSGPVDLAKMIENQFVIIPEILTHVINRL